jgi:hypothetical protein
MKHPTSVNGRKYTNRDMVRDYQWRKYRRRMAERRAERPEREGCFGVLLALLTGAGAIVGIAAQWVG